MEASIHGVLDGSWLEDILQIGFYESASQGYSSAAKGIIRDQHKTRVQFCFVIRQRQANCNACPAKSDVLSALIRPHTHQERKPWWARSVE